jgi:membrane-associated phospholipid phosphatase
LDPIYIQEIQIINWIQSVGDWFTPLALFFSLIGSQVFYVFLAPAIYWCIDPILGIRAALYLTISGGLNTILKAIFHSPRPYWYSTDVKALSGESTFGEPSGHAQSNLVVWGTIALKIRRRWSWILAIVMIFFISLSRIYLAVHFPSDVLLGWVVAILLLWLLVRYEDPFLTWFKKINQFVQVIFIFLSSMSFIVLFVLISVLNGSDVVLQAWIDTAAIARPGTLPIDPLSITSIVSSSGGFLGTALGALWMGKLGWFSVRDPGGNLALRFLIGLIGVIILWAGLGSIFPSGREIISLVLLYIRYALTTLWITWAAPRVFIKLKLAQPGI